MACKGLQYDMVKELKVNNPCKVRDVDSCWLSFSTTQLDGIDNYTAQILDTRGKIHQSTFDLFDTPHTLPTQSEIPRPLDI